MSEASYAAIPKQTLLGIQLLWGYIGFDLTRSLLDFFMSDKDFTQGGTVPAWVHLVGVFFVTALFAFFVRKASKGRNWARIVILILFLLSLLALFFVQGWVLFLQLAILGAGTILLFVGPSSAWFNSMKASRPQNSEHGDA